ncbi:DUF4352 domain-containing protein [Anaerocolumna sp. AGMB13020]|uniref:DUF4352 domain-containing protein n=1 Tax=Anaerocolumna sp. AGMB13020 TaxID=3081750 RepID=UPI00295389AA|nr:DUF4352 domain-containing protein [Anaerocolumna sp. AGMB13020]WOO36228.1 DUF4352 domain-containing protein [Anaerocolumna sp. AGMB13020]
MKKPLLLLTLFCGMMFTGCAKMTDLSDQQSDVIAEYMAGSVLRYTDNYKEALIYPEDTKDEQNNGSIINESKDTTTEENTANTAPDNEETNKGAVTTGNSTGTKNTEAVKSDLTYQEFYKIISDNKYQFKYTDYKLQTSYAQREAYFTLTPTSGNKLLAVNFKVSNKSKSSVKVNLEKIHIVYKLSTKDGKSYSPMVTLLDTDLKYLNLTLKSGKSDDAVLLFDVPENLKTDGLTLSISLNGQKAIIDLNE